MKKRELLDRAKRRQSVFSENSVPDEPQQKTKVASDVQKVVSVDGVALSSDFHAERVVGNDLKLQLFTWR